MLFQLLTTLALFASASGTALDDYVWRADENYKWVDMGADHIIRGPAGIRGWTGYTLNVTSQKWLTDEDFSADSESKSIWWHYLVVVVPDNLKWTTNATLWITGGSMGNSAPNNKSGDVLEAAAIATQTGIITGCLYQIPNEHTKFAGDPIQKSRSEDAIIAYTWDHFLKDPSQPEWLVRFPMVKGALRAMDAMTEFIATKPELGCQLDYYSVAGASKRGWTTWLVGAVDPNRVMAIVPVVLDAINFVEVEHHQWKSYGGWTYALQDYLDMDIMTRLDDPNMVLLQEMEDPYFYKDRLTMPKLVVNSVMDEFQQPDDTRFWWTGMPEPKHFLIAPNAEHSCATSIFEIVPAIGAFLQNILLGEKIPTVTWDINDSTGAIVATLGDDSVVHSATLWYAYSCGVNTWDNGTFRRDYRIAHMDSPCTCGVAADDMCTNLNAFWRKKEVEPVMVKGKRTYTAQVDAPGDGRWVAFFLDFKFVNKHAVPNDYTKDFEGAEFMQETLKDLSFTRKFPEFGGFPHDFGRFFEFTTEVSVWPTTYAYADCYLDGCDGPIV